VLLTHYQTLISVKKTSRSSDAGNKIVLYGLSLQKEMVFGQQDKA
jgi:hypothetical protein